MLILVTGPISSGTRLACRLLDASPDAEAVHDDAHGFIDEWLEPYEALVIITRDDLASNASRQRKNRQTMSTSAQLRIIDRLRGRVPTIDITYEELCADPPAMIARLAEFLNVEPWTFDEEIVSQNEKWYGGPEPAPELHPERAARVILRSAP